MSRGPVASVMDNVEKEREANISRFTCSNSVWLDQINELLTNLRRAKLLWIKLFKVQNFIVVHVKTNI